MGIFSYLLADLVKCWHGTGKINGALVLLSLQQSDKESASSWCHISGMWQEASTRDIVDFYNHLPFSVHSFLFNAYF